MRGAREFAESFSVDGLLGRRVDCGCAPRVPVGPCPPAPCAPPTPQPYCEEDCICSPWLKCWKQRYNTCKCYVPVCDHRRCADEHSCGENACGTCVPDNSVCSLLTEGVVCALIKLLFSNEDSPAINYDALLCFTEWLSNNGYCNSADTARGRVDAFIEMLSHVLPDNSSLCLLEDIGLIDFLLGKLQSMVRSDAVV